MLFNKDLNGSLELYEISGTFQASSDFHGIESEIESATAEVAAIVGEAVIAAAEAAYQAVSPSAEEKALADAVRKPVAFLAISMHARLNALSHGETGRKLKVDENEKIPFEWMVDRDDREMRERYYRALDALFRYLETTSIEAWKTSANRIRLQGSAVKSMGALEDVYPVEHSYYMFYRLLPLMLEFQEGRLRKLIGDERMDALVSGSEMAAPWQDAARLCIILHAIATAVRRWSVETFPLAIARRFSPSYQGNRSSTAAATKEIDWYVENILKQASEAETELMSALSGNPYDEIPLIPENDPGKKYFTV